MIVVDIGRLISQRGHDMQAFSISESVLRIRGGPIERARAKAINLHFMRPYVGVQCLEIIVEYEAIFVVSDVLHLRETDVCAQEYADHYTPHTQSKSCVLCPACEDL